MQSTHPLIYNIHQEPSLSAHHHHHNHHQVVNTQPVISATAAVASSIAVNTTQMSQHHSLLIKNQQFNNNNNASSFSTTTRFNQTNYQFQQKQQQQLQQNYSSLIALNVQPKWSIRPTATVAVAVVDGPEVVSPAATATATGASVIDGKQQKQSNRGDDDNEEHFNRHLENLNKSEDDDDNIIVEEKEELNEFKLSKLINVSKANHRSHSHHHNVNTMKESDDDYLVGGGQSDEPKVFQVEEDVEDETRSIKVATPPIPPAIQPAEAPVIVAVKPGSGMNESVMPTPLAYSRSSSLTSLNSFSDVKSIHSSVASEYSHRCIVSTSASSNPSSKALKDNGGGGGGDELDEDEETAATDLELDNELNDLQMPDSPLNGQADSSFLLLQRYKHKQQQALYRQTAQSWQQQPVAAITAAATITDLHSSFMSKLNISKTKLNELNETTRTMTTTPVTPTSESIKQTVLATTTTTTTTTSAVTSGIKPNTPPIKLLSTMGSKFVPQPLQLQQQHQHPNSVLGTSLMQQQQQQQQHSTSGTAQLAPMSVTYAFMKNSNNPNSCFASMQPPLQPAQPPKFLISSSSSNQMPANFNKCILPLSNQQQQSSSASTTTTTTNTTATNGTSNQPSPPQQPLVNDLLPDTPALYSVEHRLFFNGYHQPNHNSHHHPLNTASSPPESICSRMSDSSIPSLIRQDINLNKNKFHTILSAKNNSKSSKPSSDFKALFNKLNTNITATATAVVQHKPVLLAKQEDKEENEQEKEEDDTDEEEEQPKNFLNEEEPPFDSIASHSNNNYPMMSNNQTLLFLKSHPANNAASQIYAFNASPLFYSNLNNNNPSVHVVYPTTPKQQENNAANDSLSFNDQLLSANHLNNMNTPAGVCNQSGASLIDEASPCQSQSCQDDEKKPETKTKTSPKAAAAVNICSTNDPGDIDLDLENFINEMLPKQTKQSPTDSVKTNFSSKSTRLGGTKQLVKRASLQNIDIKARANKRLSVCSNDEKINKVIAKTIHKPPIATTANMNVKQQQPATSAKHVAKDVVKSSKQATYPTSSSIHPPFITMTKTSQLRSQAAASKQTAPKPNQPAAAKPPTASSSTVKPLSIKVTPKKQAQPISKPVGGSVSKLNPGNENARRNSVGFDHSNHSSTANKLNCSTISSASKASSCKKPNRLATTAMKTDYLNNASNNSISKSSIKQSTLKKL